MWLRRSLSSVSRPVLPVVRTGDVAQTQPFGNSAAVGELGEKLHRLFVVGAPHVLMSIIRVLA